jgi:hypothetical protein
LTVNVWPSTVVDRVRPTACWSGLEDDVLAVEVPVDLNRVNTGRYVPPFWPRPTVNWSGLMCR